MKRNKKRLSLLIVSVILALALTALVASASTKLTAEEYSAEYSAKKGALNLKDGAFDGEEDCLMISTPAPLSLSEDLTGEEFISNEGGKANVGTTTDESETNSGATSDVGEVNGSTTDEIETNVGTTTDEGETNSNATSDGGKVNGNITDEIETNVGTTADEGETNSGATSDGGEVNGNTTDEIETNGNAPTDGDKANNSKAINEEKANPFENVYSTVISYSGDIFSALSFIVGLVLALLCKKTVLPVISKVGGAIKGSVDTAAKDNERLARCAEEKLLLLGEKAEALAESFKQLEERLDPNVLKADTDTIRRALALEADLVYSILMGSALPTYLKDELNDKMKTIKAVLGDAE